MTDNRETIEMLKILKEQALKSHNDTAVLEVKIDSFNFVLDEAIKALEEKPCENAISRQAVLSYISNELGFGDEENGYDLERKIAQEEIYNFVKKMPSVTPKEKTGKWVEGGYEDMYYVCSECDYKASEYWYKPFYKYCPNCGAKMVEPQESEDNDGSI